MNTMLLANLGVSTWDVLHIGVASKLPLSIGTAVIVVGILLILLTCALNKVVPKVGTFINAVLVGVFFDLIQHIPFSQPELLWQRAILLVVGVLMMGMGSGMYVATNIGAGPRDGFTLAVAKKLNFSIRTVRTILEAVILLIGGALGGPISIGTFVSIILIGSVLQVSLFFWRKQLEMLGSKWGVHSKINQ